MLEVFDKNRKRIAILQSAFKISEELKINSVNYFKFLLPQNDPKNMHCKPFNYIRYNNGQLYRIMPSISSIDELGNTEYVCEHGLALLIDKIMYSSHIVGNIGYYTPDVINYILDHQITKNWVLGKCDFNHQYQYEWSYENLLAAIFSVPAPFVDKYMWTFDTSVYPFILNLKKIDENIKPQMYVRLQKNMLKLVKSSDPTMICTRLYPLGQGEGINQLNIEKITGKPYIQSPQEYIDKYGIVEKVFSDRRHTTEESLLDASIALLNELQEPYEEYEVDFATLGSTYYDTVEIGKIIEIIGFKKTIITGIQYNYDDIEKSKLSIANKPKDIASSISDIADRQRIESTYANGASQFYQDHIYDNADQNTPLTLKLMIPRNMKIINEIMIDVEIGPFRTPFEITGGAGGGTISQSNTESSGNNESIQNTSESGGGKSTTTYDEYVNYGKHSVLEFIATDGRHTHEQYSHGHSVDVQSARTYGNLQQLGYLAPDLIRESGSHNHTTYVHGHTVDIPSHVHGITLPTHKHSIKHTHTIGDHVHDLKPKIEFQGNASTFDLILNGKKIKTVNAKNLQENITNLLVNDKNEIERGVYHRIEILPNDISYVMLTVNVQGFIQSKGDKQV